MLDIISIGDATLDTFVRVRDASVNDVTGLKIKQLCLNFGDKLPVSALHEKVAGNALNNAVGSARLGLKAGFYSVIGDDDTGVQIVKKMRREKISLKYLQIQKRSATNHSIVINFGGDRTILTYSHPREYSLPKEMEPARWVYYTAIGKKHAALEKQIIDYACKCHAKIAFNPGTAHLREGVAKMRELLRHTEIIFLNREEAEMLVGDSADIPNLLYRLHELGPHIAVITDGKNGAYASDSVNVYNQPIFPMKVVENTGAGDAFATGFIAALFHGNSVPEAMRWGAANAGSVVTKIGPQDGLLTLMKLKSILRQFKHIKTKIVSNGKKK
jgi:ribokinase